MSCHCPRWRDLFSQATGHQLPAGADPNDMAWKQWVIWHERRLEDLWRFWDGLVKEHKPGTFWMGNHSDRGFLADAAVRIGKAALAENVTLKDAAAKLGLVSPEDFDRWVRPEQMVEPGATLAGG